MAIKNKYSATTTCDLLLTSDYARKQPRRQSIVAADESLIRTIIRVVPRGSELIGIEEEEPNSGAPEYNQATFITNVVANPIQNLKNFSRAMRRFQVGRSGLGAGHIEFAALADSDVRARIHVATTITSFNLQKKNDTSLKHKDAFECFSNKNESKFSLPAANRSNIGLEYYFAVNPEGGTLTVTCDPGRDNDVIQMRQRQELEFEEKIGRVATNGVVSIPPTDSQLPPEDEPVVRCGRIKATHDPKAKLRTTVVLACRGIGLWIAENVAACDLADTKNPDPPRKSLWIPADIRDA